MKDSAIGPTSLCLGNISKNWSVDNMKKNWIKWVDYDFSVDYSETAVTMLIRII